MSTGKSTETVSVALCDRCPESASCLHCRGAAFNIQRFVEQHPSVTSDRIPRTMYRYLLLTERTDWSPQLIHTPQYRVFIRLFLAYLKRNHIALNGFEDRFRVREAFYKFQYVLKHASQAEPEGSRETDRYSVFDFGALDKHFRRLFLGK